MEANGNYPYVFRSQGTRVRRGTSGSIISYNSDLTKPELYLAFVGENADSETNKVNQENYATFLRTTNFAESGLYYEEGKLLVAADSILIGTAKDPKFYADTKNNNVSIAGWVAETDSLYIKNKSIGTEGSYYLVSQGNTKAAAIAGSESKNNWRLAIGKNFGVDANGALYAAGSGKIGGWDITNDGLNTNTVQINAANGELYPSLVSSTE
jgi:hypothetical protein